ncbi:MULTISPECIES: type I methionyl aminopeptidase [Glycomyces]|uniref:Methionine aminopeptidase n=2 Tax=Glycomyces TaxID=58113 RepID=A0A9X3SWM9_9ACTN|nr:type I methionyl aminopeptidase [Glycomyces lechevalierae]MDA1387404.1 type I methionyl aminopeptidase [Glycomyces lechevalierae]MDR7340156.1 methionyl aminopeptidase [Glycomyces lechevalierae]
METRPALRPGRQSPRRSVPDSIERPEYVGKPAPSPFTGSEVKDAETVERMRIAGRIAADALETVGKAVAPGVTTDELDRIAHEYLCDLGAYPSTLGYREYPKSCCTSLNEVICHGIPDSTVVQDGDIVNIDITAFIGGVHGDCNATFLAGDVSQEARDLVERTWTATWRGIKAVKPGRQLNVVGKVIEAYAKRFGYGVVRQFTGHGIGTAFHSGLYVPHYDNPELEVEIETGMTFTIEPMINLGTAEHEMWDDGWTAVTRDRKWTAQFEHTLLVTDDGFEILTMPSSGVPAGTPDSQR